MRVRPTGDTWAPALDLQAAGARWFPPRDSRQLHLFGHRPLPRTLAVAEALDHAGPVGLRTVLTELGLPLDLRHRELDADDPAQLPRDIRLRGVGHVPARITRGL